MKILFLCHRFPFPPDSGARIRPFHMLKHLTRVHDVTLASLVRSDDNDAARPRAWRDGLQTLLAPVSELMSCWRAAATLPTRDPASMGYFYSPRLATALHAELARQRYDFICVHSSSMAPYVASVQGIPKMLDFADMDSQKWLAYAAHRRFPLSAGFWLEGWKLARREAELAGLFDVCTCTTPEEIEALRNCDENPRNGWFPNGVDTDYFSMTDAPYDPDTICFLGRMDYYPNHECILRFCADTLPRLRRRRPRLTVLIIGANPTRAVRRLAAQPGIEVTGSVADVRPYARRAALSIAPLGIARGMQNKILESLAMGIPVVCSPIAARGIDATPGEHLLVAEDARVYADLILHLLDNPSERRRLAAAGRARMVSHYSWDRSMRQFDALLDQCLSSAARRGAPASHRVVNAPGQLGV